ncbi:DUF1080 domain-containing protein [Spirosoma taeanense]|uniref:DUF1080 domain-containing protein n=1 Tax=Spirosoma taeanense TaxID=2735870 RepID=A0A6M5YAN3_9BACT|nr:DUF1080 domain-containing protein [Spirosoma taeanense]QJW90340.1 DUF1080 domain-containing protein [Spirosoma taeanense]
MKNQAKRLLVGGLLGCMLLPAALAQTANVLTPKEKKEGWTLLFDGVSANGWTTPSGNPVPAGWEVKNGTLTARKGAKGGDIVSVNQYGDFDLMLDFNIEPGGNSGVKYFYTNYEKGGKLGMEYQILDDKLAEDNKKENHLTGSFYDVIPPNAAVKKVNEPGQWNTLRIVAKGNKVEHWLNGIKILAFSRGSQPFTEAVAQSKFSKAVPAFGTVEQGRFLLQEHGSEISFRNIKVKQL